MSPKPRTAVAADPCRGQPVCCELPTAAMIASSGGLTGWGLRLQPGLDPGRFSDRSLVHDENDWEVRIEVPRHGWDCKRVGCLSPFG